MPDFKSLSLLYVEDEPELREHVAFALRLHCDCVATAANGKEALEQMRLHRPDILISDIRMPVMDGLELSAVVKNEFPGVPTILCTAFSDAGYLLKAIELGVSAYVTKPIDTAYLLEAVQKAALPLLQRREIDRLKAETFLARGMMFGTSPAMKALGEQLAQLADSDFSVVLSGEPGTGKSAAAELLHSMSRRKEKPLLTVDCRGRSAEQLEAELFGPAAGRGRPSAGRTGGILREISGGTLVLDSPELLPLPLQGRLLRLLEERCYQPSGSAEVVPCDVRVVTLTAVELDKKVLSGTFLPALWLKLSDMVVTVPPLRQRIEDIPRFCRAFLAQAADELGRHCPELAPDALQLLQQEPWPGNLRQLKLFMRRALFLAGDPIIANGLKPLLAATDVPGAASADLPPSLKLTDLEEWAIRQALVATGGKKMQAAELLGISYNSFKEKLRRYSIKSLQA